MFRHLTITLLYLTAFAGCVSAQGFATVRVSQATDLDWTFALSNQSLKTAPDGWLPDTYDSKQQKYDVVTVPRRQSDPPMSLLLFVSPSDNPAGFREWTAVCRRKNIVLASPYGAGNKCPGPKRVRIVMDVLSDLKSKHNIDPDRTYIGGFSGGGRIACMIAFALPEYFGGVLPVCAGGELRKESWLRHRVVDRLSVAQLTAEKDFNRGEVERLRQRELELLGVRCKTWVAKRAAHEIPSASWFTQAWDWMEADLKRRRQLADKWPASRVGSISRQQWADQLLNEATKRIANPKTNHTGLMQLKGIRVRWQDLEIAEKATEILTEAENGNEQTWQAADKREQLKAIYARASGLDAYASGDLAKPYVKQKASLLEAAIGQWQQFRRYTTDSKQIAEAKNRIDSLQEMLDAI